MSNPVTFLEFGPQFIAGLLTGRLLEAQVRGAIASRIWIDEPEATGFADFKGVDPIFPRAERCQLSCDATVHLTLNLVTTQLGPLPPIDTVVPLKLVFEAYSPLYLLADIPEVTAGNVKLDYKTPNPLKWGAIEFRVRAKLVEAINEKVKKSRHERIIDFEALLLEQTAHAGDDPAKPPPPAVNLNSRGDVLIPRNDIAAGQVSPGQSLTGFLLLNKNERLRILTYGRILDIPALMFSFGASGEISVKGNKQVDSSTFSVVVGEAWGDNYSLNTFPDDPAGFAPAASGWYQFVLKTDKQSPSKCEFLIKQERTIGDVDLLAHRAAICFDELGRNLFHIGLSKEVLRRMIAAQIQIAIQTHKLQLPWNDCPFFGPVLVSLTPTLKGLEPYPSASPESEVLWTLDVTAKFRVMREKEQLLMLPLTIRPTLAMVATKNPTAIQVELRPLQKGDFTVDEKNIQIINKTVEMLVKMLLHGKYVNQFEAWVTGFSRTLLQSLAVNTQVISALAEKRADETRPKAAGPRPVFDGKPFKSVRVAAGAAEYYKVALRKKQTVVGTATITPLKRPGRVGATVSLAICDEMHGLLADAQRGAWDTGESRKKVLSLRFTAPDDGSYQFRVRANPTGGEDYEGVQCEFKITEVKK